MVVRQGAASDSVVSSISRVSQADLARAMLERAVHRHEKGEGAELRSWPLLKPDKE